MALSVNDRDMKERHSLTNKPDNEDGLGSRASTGPCREIFDAALLDDPGTVLIDDRGPGCKGGCSYLLHSPVDTIVAESIAEVPGAFVRLDESLRAGRFVAGYISYDAGIGLDGPIRSRHSIGGPLMWLGIFLYIMTVIDVFDGS